MKLYIFVRTTSYEVEMSKRNLMEKCDMSAVSTSKRQLQMNKRIVLEKPGMILVFNSRYKLMRMLTYKGNVLLYFSM